jgi:hypothetical protein
MAKLQKIDIKVATAKVEGTVTLHVPTDTTLDDIHERVEAKVLAYLLEKGFIKYAYNVGVISTEGDNNDIGAETAVR